MSRTPEPTWEAVYEPGNVSSYFIGYLNDEKPAKAAAEAWLRSQATDIGNLAWDQWGQLGQFDENGLETDTGLVVRRRTETASSAPESELQRLRADLDAVNDALREAGIEYPLGARGVRDLGQLLRGAIAARDEAMEAATEIAEQERAHIVAALKRAAAGRIEYAEPIKGDDHPEKTALLVEARNFNTAARVARGDKATLAALIPSWRWTDEEAAATPPPEQSGEAS